MPPKSNLVHKIKKYKVATVTTLIWSFVVAFVAINEYLIFFSKQSMEFEFSWFIKGEGAFPPFERWRGFGLTTVDYVLIFLASITCGAILFELKTIFYCSMLAFIFAMIFTSFFIAVFIWNVLGWGKILLTTPYGWSWAMYWGFLNAFRAMFPAPMAFLIVSAFFGSFLRYLLPFKRKSLNGK